MSFPTTYNTQAAWMEQQDDQWHDDVATLNTFSNATCQLLYMIKVLAPELGETASDMLAWRAHDENIVSGIFQTDIQTMTDCYNDVLNQGYAGDLNEEMKDVDTAMDAANQALWFAFTCPPFSEDTEMQSTFVTAMSDFFECTPTTKTYMITVDGKTSPVSVPQFDPNAVSEGNTYTNDEQTKDYWVGERWDSPNPNDKYYQEYISEQSGWNQDLTMMSDSCDQLDAQMQGLMQQNETTQNQINGTWNDMIQQKAKGVAAQIKNELTE